MRKIFRFSAIQRGLAIISAIVILVILASLGAVALTFSTSQHVSSGQDLLSVQALYAARAGIEWGAYRQRVDGSCLVGPTTVATTAPTLARFTISVTCDSSPDPSGRTDPVIRVISTACNEPFNGSCPNTDSPSSMYVERQMEILF